jgi:hypothetical protein
MVLLVHLVVFYFSCSCNKVSASCIIVVQSSLCSCVLVLCLNFVFVLQFALGEEVWLINPKRSTQKVASGKVSGVAGEHKFHFKEILEK